MLINILFPVLNETLRLEKGITKCVEYMQKNITIPYRLTILDNGSTDDTPEIARKLADQYETVEYIRIEARGVGIAFKTGIERTEADIVGYMDIDLSTDLKHLSDMINCFREDEELQYVNGSRFSSESDTRGRRWYRKITSAGLVWMLKSYLHMRSTDALCGFTFLRTPLAKELIAECGEDYGWFYTVEFLLRAERKGVKILDMPVQWTEDYHSTVHIWKTIKDYIRQMRRVKKTFRREGI